jgi:hypothetical protein
LNKNFFQHTEQKKKFLSVSFSNVPFIAECNAHLRARAKHPKVTFKAITEGIAINMQISGFKRKLDTL